MDKSKFSLILTLLLFIASTGCGNLNIDTIPTGENGGDNIPVLSTPTEDNTQDYLVADVQFTVEVPNNTPEQDTIYLSIVDEVTGIALNPVQYEMTLVNSNSDEQRRSYTITLPLVAGSSINYRYAHQGDSIALSEHTSIGDQVRYRIINVDGPTVTNDIVSRWTDTPYEEPSGYLIGQVHNTQSGQPVPDLLVTAGGIQTITESDGSFFIDTLPEGVHTLVVYSKDGAYKTFQQGARISAELPTIAPIEVDRREFVDVTFSVSLPEETPPLVPVRLAGSLSQLGNSFTNLPGGMSGSIDQMPTLVPSEDNVYSTTISLPVGAYLNYKYTLGDGFWNAEHSTAGEFLTRELIVPNSNTILYDSVESWYSSKVGVISFDVRVPENTPPEDNISIQFNPLFGWTVPIPMWNIGENRWGYILFSPLNLPGNLSYRYCRNGDCGALDDIATPGIYGAGRPVDNINNLPISISDTIEGWVDLSGN